MTVIRCARLAGFLLLLTFTGSLACEDSFAALGDSEADLQRRYGKPASVQPGGQNGINVGADRTLFFLVQEPLEIIELQVGVIGGQSVAETYFFMDNQGNPRPLSREKAERYVQASSQGHQWSPVPVHLFPDSDNDGQDDYLFVWARSDSKQTTAAIQRNAKHGLKIESSRYKASRDAAAGR